MSNLNYIEKMLYGIDVAWLPLGKIGNFIRGSELQERDFVKDGFPAIHHDQIHTKYALEAGNTFTYVSEDLAQKIKKAQKNDLLLVTTSENDEDVVKPLACFGAQMAISSDMMLFQHKQNVKYLAYFVQTKKFQKQKRKYITGGKVWRVSSEDLAKIYVPIPCPDDSKKSLEIQSEIVRILDTFTSLTDELTAELTARKKQYNYYREQLLTFPDDEVEWKPLEKIAEYSKNRISHEQLDETNYVGVNNLLQNCAGKEKSSHIPTSGNLTEYREGDILIGNIRPYLKKIWHADCVGGTNGDVLVVRTTDEAVSSRYLYQVLADSKFFEYNMQHANGTKMPRGNKSKIMEYSVPIPKNEDKQTCIVSILDRFDALTNSLSEGLPREIDLRQKQYEYYRDLLLNFPEP